MRAVLRRLPLLRGSIVAAIFALGLAGFTGSSWWYEARVDSLNDPATRSQDRELFAFSRPIRGDEYRVDLPLASANQRSEPAFPMVNLNLGLGHLQRNPFDVPVLDWGVVIRPWTWPLFVGDRWSHGVRWFMREALLLAGLFAWFGVLAGRTRDGEAHPRRRLVAALGAVAVFFSSHLVWWRGHAMPEVIALAGVVLWAADRAARASSRRALAGWVLLVAWLSACAFSAFYAPIWAAVLWILCGSIFDVQLRARRNWLGAATSTATVLLAVGAGVAVAIAYYTPYLAVVVDSLYPGGRLTSGGSVPWERLTAMFWPSLHAYARPHGYEMFHGTAQVPGNVCEAATVEVPPFFLLLPAALVSRRVRSAVWSAVRERPGLTAAIAVLAAWVFLPVPPVLGALALLRWTQGFRAWMPLGVGLALLTAATLAELAARPAEAGPRFAWKELLVAAMVVVAMAVVGRAALPPEGRRFWFPLLLTAALLLVGAAKLGTPRGALLLALGWAVPLFLSTVRVNPLLRSRDLFHESDAHRIVAETLARTPGRLADYDTHYGATLGGFGWPVLTHVDTAPQASLWRFLEPDVPGLDETTWNRYAHVKLVLPPAPTRLVQADYFIAQLSPCSARAAALGVNHLLTRRDDALPPACAAEFEGRPLRELVLWSRRRPVGVLGVRRGERPASALEFDWSAGAAPDARVTPMRDRVVVDVPAAPGTHFAYAVNLGVVDEIECTHASAALVDTHVVVSPRGGERGRCDVRFLGTRGAVLRLLKKRAGPVIIGDDPVAAAEVRVTGAGHVP